jgi:hypothetical protein
MEQKSFLKPIVYFFATVGLLFSIMALIAILNTKMNTQYLFSVSQKLRADYFQATEYKYNNQFNQNKKFGEFCYRLTGNEIDNGKINLTTDEQKIRGSLYYNNQLYAANIDPDNLNLAFDKDSGNLKWKWYNWLGFGF